MQSWVNWPVDQNESSHRVCMSVVLRGRCDIHRSYFFLLYKAGLLVLQEKETQMGHEILLMELVHVQVAVVEEAHLEIVLEAGSFVGVVLMTYTLVQEVSVLAKNSVNYLFIMRLF